MGCGGSKDEPKNRDIEEAEESEPPPAAEPEEVSHEELMAERSKENVTPASFDGLVMCSLAAMLRMCDNLESAECKDLVVQVNKLLDIVATANCPTPWSAYLSNTNLQTATVKLVQALADALKDDSDKSVGDVVLLLKEKAVFWDEHYDQLLLPVRDMVTSLRDYDEDFADGETTAELHRLVNDAWIDIGVLTLTHYAHATCKQLGKTVNAAACGEIGLVTLRAVLRGESVVSAELEAMWGEVALMRQTVKALENQEMGGQDKAKKSLTILQMSKSQTKVAAGLLADVERAQAGERPVLFSDPDMMQQVGYLLVELHCRGYANGGAIVQRAAQLLSQVMDAQPVLPDELFSRLAGIHKKLGSLCDFLSVDLAGAAELEQQLIKASTDMEFALDAASGLRAILAERCRLLTLNPVRRSETVVASSWELGSAAEYGHLHLLYRMLTEAEKLDVAEHHPNVSDVKIPPGALKSVADRVEALKWDKGEMYSKVQGTLSVLDILNTAESVAAGAQEPALLIKVYSDGIGELNMDYITSCGTACFGHLSSRMHPVEALFNTISRISRGKSSLETLAQELVAAWPAVYDLILDGIAMASANRITQMLDATIKSSIGVHNLMVLLRAERSMLNELQAEMMGLLSWTELNDKISVACANHSGAFELHEAATATSAALENAKVDSSKAKASLAGLEAIKQAGNVLITSRTFDHKSQRAVLECARVLLEQNVAGYRANELAQLVVALELKSVRQPDIDAVNPMEQLLRIRADETQYIGKLLSAIQDFQQALGPVEVTDEMELELNSKTLKRSSAQHKEHQEVLRAVQLDWLKHRQLHLQSNRLGVCLRGDMPDSAADYYKDNLRVAFLELDRDRDGIITMDELKTWLQLSFWQDMPPILQGLNKGSDTDEIHKVFKMIDTNGDGVISFDEFRAMMENEISDKLNPKTRRQELDEHPITALPTMGDMDLEQAPQTTEPQTTLAEQTISV